MSSSPARVPVYAIPLDRSRPSAPTFRRAEARGSCAAGTDAPRLLAALHRLFSCYAAQDEGAILVAQGDEILMSALGAEAGDTCASVLSSLAAPQPSPEPASGDRILLCCPHGPAAPDLRARSELCVVLEAEELIFDFDPDLFEPTTIGMWLACTTELLEVLASPGDTPWVDLRPYAGVADLRPSHLEAAYAGPGPGGSIPARFQEAVRRNPEAPALLGVGAAEGRLSYAALDARSNQLARLLRKEGIGRGSMVAIYQSVRLDTVVSILGVLKAGAAYLPIDLSYPAERVAFMLEDAAVPCVLTTTDLCPDLPDGGPTRLCIDTLQDELAAQEQSELADGPTVDEPAYVIYTSGSTGKPKGVPVTHKNVLRLFDHTQHWFGFDASDTWMLFHSVAFDFSVWEIWGALFHGGRLLVLPFEVTRDPEACRSLIAEQGVTVLNQTPTAFNQLIREDSRRPGGEELALRWVIFGGEALELQNLKPWFDRHPRQPRLVNMYGITETTVHVTYREIRKKDVRRPVGSLIGVPIPDLSVTLVDADLNPVPRGFPGEILVAGGGVTGAYLNRPELSAERFFAAPQPPIQGQLVYRTGDLARLSASGELQYLRRIDSQIQLHGFRIELEEIRGRMLRVPGIAEAVVRLEEGDTARLIAWYVPDPAPGPSASELRAALAVALPTYMLPSVYVPVPDMPRTAHGKLDLDALPRPTEPQAAADPEAEPIGETEHRISQVFLEVLDSQTVGRRENFFAVGGDSLRITRVAEILRQRHGIEVEIVELFENPTIESLARLLSSRTTSASATRDAAERGQRQRAGRVRRMRRGRDAQDRDTPR